MVLNLLRELKLDCNMSFMIEKIRYLSAGKTAVFSINIEQDS